MKIEFQSGCGFAAPASWSLILMGLRAESGVALFGDEFEEWVLKEWNIRLLHNNEVFPSHLTGMEMDEQTLTMLMLKFPSAFSKASFAQA